MQKFKIHKFVAGLCGCSVVLAAVGCNRGENAPSTNADPAKVVNVARVTVGKPQRKTLIAKTTQPARIEAFEETPLFTKIAGYVGEVHVDIGDKVTKDQSLVTLRVPELADDVQQNTALVNQAEAEFKQAEAAVAAANAAAETAMAKIAEAQANTTRAAGEYERWKGEYERVKLLAGNGSVTQKLADETLNQFRAAEAAREAAAAAVQSAEAMSRQAQANTVKAEADRAAAGAHVAVAKADLAHANTMFSYSEIRAPYDGVVVTRSVDTGHYVQPASSGPKPIMTVARTDEVRIFVDVPEMEAGGVAVGDPSVLHVQALPESEISAKVTRTSWSLDPANRSLRVEIDVPNAGSHLRPGMYAMATIELAHRENALTMPATAIVRDGNVTYCYCVENDTAKRCAVKLGIRGGPDFEVIGGLDEQQSIVLVHPETLIDGQSLAIESPNK